ncbi:hypothetical protein SAMN05421505_11667 [Sinosporangium album]|uniref:Uncharacterized protein n=1 Tax=Sinosporangium album TaxID=504805 RepID=A0A1G8CMM4_9ACTN|nr:hypothetical protein [Sinosporangium album]SDH46602.1 hypothetical protein SAMN05421505_11667 [Sinosporangium album]
MAVGEARLVRRRRPPSALLALLITVLLATGQSGLATATWHSFSTPPPVQAGPVRTVDNTPTSQPAAPEWPVLAVAGGFSGAAPAGGASAVRPAAYSTAGVAVAPRPRPAPRDTRVHPLADAGVAPGRAPPSPQV